MKRFNTTGVCIPEKHYMVDIRDRLDKIRDMVEDGDYFSINRGRQYGKTTTLYMLERFLKNDYQVISISFEAADDLFKNDETFACGLLKKITAELKMKEAAKKLIDISGAALEGNLYWDSLSTRIKEFCESSEKPVVLIIDEVDKSSDNQIFLTFLGMLRDMYLTRQKYDTPAFQTVILAGVYDISHLKLKIRSDEEHKLNSPWNIAASFDVDMSFSLEQIRDMLIEYESDHKIGFSPDEIATIVYDYTSGYPFLVSKICRMLDEDGFGWSLEGVSDAIRTLLGENIPLFSSLKKQLIDYPHMDSRIRSILFSGNRVPDNPDDEDLLLAKMFGFIRADSGQVKIANRIFETRLYNFYMTTVQATDTAIYKAGEENRNIFVQNGQLDMDLVVERFVVTFNDIFGSETESFVEDEGRKYFLLYLKPIINGTGNYYIEAETRDRTRTDIVVDYHGKQYVIELKIWRGDSYNKRGEKQLFDYLEYYHADCGWMVSFCFSKDKKIGVHEVRMGEKTIVEAVV